MCELMIVFQISHVICKRKITRGYKV